MSIRPLAALLTVAAALLLPQASALALRSEFLLASYDVGDLVPEGPEADKRAAELAEEIKSKVNPEAWKRLADSRVSLDWNEKPAAEALAFLADSAGVKIVPDSEIKKPVTLRLRDVSGRTALAWTSRLLSMRLYYRDGELRLSSDWD